MPHKPGARAIIFSIHKPANIGKNILKLCVGFRVSGQQAGINKLAQMLKLSDDGVAGTGDLKIDTHVLVDAAQVRQNPCGLIGVAIAGGILGYMDETVGKGAEDLDAVIILVFIPPERRMESY